MSCTEWQAEIALYVERDLPARRFARIEMHLAQCRGCREFADQLRESQAELRQMRNEVIDAVALHRIRAGVLAEIQAIEDRRTWLSRLAIRFWSAFRLRYVMTACLALLFVSATVWQTRHTLAPSMPTVASASVAETPATTIAQPTVAAVQTTVVHRQFKRKSVHPKTAGVVQPRPDLVVQIQTDDPNIIIYWLIDQNTGGSE